MDAQIKKGLVDACMLKVLVSGDSYGYKLTQDVQEIMEISESTLYPVLRRLEAQGCLETYNAESQNRIRRYYRLTKQGEQRLEKTQTQWRKAVKVIEFILGGSLHEQI